jgi:hypothetical protein
MTQGRANGFIHHFMIDAPTLDYRMELFSVSHDMDLYPVRVETWPSVRLDLPPGQLLNSELEFVDWLKNVLNAAETSRVLNTLMAQAES